MSRAAPIRALLLGEPTLIVGGRPTPFRTSRVGALLGCLAAKGAGRASSRSAVAEALWPGRPTDLAHQSLRQTLVYLRQMLGEAAEEAIVATRKDIWLRPDAIETDVTMLRQCFEERTPESLRRGVGLCRGPFLDGFDDEWAVPIRSEIANGFVRALLELSDAVVATDPHQALLDAERAIALEPFHDGARARKIRALRRLGEETLALREFETYEAMLGDELGLRPARIVEEALSAVALEPVGAVEPPSELGEVFAVLEDSPTEALRLAASLAPYWVAAGKSTEGLRRLDHLRLPGVEEMAPGESALAAATLALAAGDSRRAIEEAEAALERLSDPRGRIRSLGILADAHLRRRSTVEARRAALAALRLGRRAEHRAPLMAAWFTVATAHRYDGEAARAAAAARRAGSNAMTRLEEARASVLLAQSRQDEGNFSAVRTALEWALSAVEGDSTPAAIGVRAAAARSFESMGDAARARAGYERAVEEYRRTDSRWGLAVALTYLGDLATETGDPARAIPLHEEARAIRVGIGDEVGEATSLRGLGNAHLRRGDPAAAREPLREAIRLYTQTDAIPGVASCLVRLAQAESAMGATAIARRLALRGARLLRNMGPVLRQTIGPYCERLLPEAEALVRDL